MENKTDLRTKFKAIRKTLNREVASRIITDKIRLHPAFINAENVMLYYPLRYEINLLRLMKEPKTFYFPKVDNKNLLVCPTCGEFKLSNLKINEPCSKPVDASILDLIIIPALAVDDKHFRLGYGGGYYDRFLHKNPNITTLTPIFKELITQNLPVEEFDIPIDIIITD